VVRVGSVKETRLRRIQFRKRLKALEAKSAQEHLILTEEQLRALERAREEKESFQIVA
jgi:hypothetical protein